MDIRQALAAFVFTACPFAAASAQSVVDVELFLAIDASSSIDSREAALQRDGYVAAFADQTVISALIGGRHGRVAVTYVEYAGASQQRVVAGWTVIASEADALAFSESLRGRPTRIGNFTAVGDVIRAGVRSLLSNAWRGRAIIDVSGDGPNNDGDAADLARDRAVAAGITVNGLPVIAGRSTVGSLPEQDLQAWYQANVIGGIDAFLEPADGFDDFARAARRKLLRELTLPGLAMVE